MPLIALTDLRAKGEQDNDPRYTALADIVDAHNGLWCPEAEEYLLANFNPRTKQNVPWDRTNADRRNPHGTTPQSNRGAGEPQRQH